MGDGSDSDMVAPGAPAPVGIAPGAPAPVGTGSETSETAGAASAAHTGPDIGSAKGTGRVPSAEEPPAANHSANHHGDIQKEREMRERMLAHRGDLQKEREMRERMLKRKDRGLSLSSPQEPTKQPRLETTPLARFGQTS